MEFLQNLLNPNKQPSYRGVQVRRQSTVDKSLRPPLKPMQSLVADRGLFNKPGENNCFLNTAVQILWHNDCFRRSFRLFEGHTCDGDPCIFCALKVLFTQFQHSGQVAIPPNALRIAMSNSYENLNRFQLGEMDDAAECFEKILEQIHYNLTGTEDLDSCLTPWCVSHQKFALTTVEQTVCQCKAQSEPLPFVEFVHYITTSQLVSESVKLKKLQQGSYFDVIVKAAGASVENLQCQNFPRCKRNPFLRRVLLNSPDIICIGFIWDSVSPQLQFIMSVVEAISTKICPRKLFDHVASDRIRDVDYHLSALITYYGRHYSTFCFHTQKQHWVYFDDANVRKAGNSWNDIVEECRKAHFQPLLLVYTNPNLQPIDASQAPKNVTLASNSCSAPDKSQSQSTVCDTKPSYVNTAFHQPASSSSQPSYMNVDVESRLNVESYTTVEHQVPTTNHSVVEQPLYDDINIRTRPTIQKQDDVEDLIQFSITPAALTRSSTDSTRPGIQHNPFMMKDFQTRTSNNPDLNTSSSYQNKQLHTASNSTRNQPNITTGQTHTTRSAVNTVQSKERSFSPNGNGKNPNQESSKPLSTSLETVIRGLPKNIRDSILHSGMCTKKATQSHDPIITGVLLECAINRIHGIVNHPSVTSHPDLHQHLKTKKEMLQKKMTSLTSELEKARSDSLTLQYALSTNEISIVNCLGKKVSGGVIQECIECKKKRYCDDRLLCGPCRLKLNLHVQ